MDYISQIFKRADLQQIRSFLLYGAEEMCVDPRPYRERIESAYRALSARMHRDYPDEEQFEEAMRPIYDYAGTVEAVYMEIGLQVGGILAAQTARNVKTALESD